MPIATGDKLPTATLIENGPDGPQQVQMSEKAAGRKIVIFGLPGAFTGTCTTAHLPSFIRTKDAFAAKGVDEIICVSVNDPFVMGAWAESTGADGITMLADASAEFTKAIGMEFTAPPVGLYDRSKRFAMIVDDGTVTVLQEEENPGVCDVSGGEHLLKSL